MFDTAKVQRMTTELEKFSREHDNVYVIMKALNADVFALFRRLKVRIWAILSNVPLYNGNKVVKKFFGLPVLKTEEATKNFNEHTGLILLTKKPAPFIQTTFDFLVNGKLIKIPAFVMDSDEVLAIYDRLTVMRILQQYLEDGMSAPSAKLLAKRFARGFNTFLDPSFQVFKFQFWDRHEYFNPRYDFADAAIVIQGQIAYANNYTVETFKFYRSIYPNAPIVVSTWKGEATDAFRQECKNNSIVLLENDLPSPQGPGHINCQLKSSFQGAKYVQENTSAKFVLKTRTDQRINRFDFLVYFKNLLETFPPKDQKLCRRIIFLSSLATKTIPFYFYDFLSFGHISDISKLYGIPLYCDPGEMSYTQRHKFRLNHKVQRMLRDPLCPVDFDSVTAPSRKLKNLNKMASRWSGSEKYISQTFYKINIAPVDETKLLETTWKFIQDYLILIDWGSILFDWPKYESRHSYEINAYSGGRTDFSRWLDIYRHLNISWL